MTTTPIIPTKRATTLLTGAPKPAATKLASAPYGATILKTTLVAGGIIATLLGANLAARQDQVATTTTTITTAAYTANTQAVAALPNLTTSDTGTTATDAILNMPLAPIPSVSVPAVTSSQSSR